MNMYHQLVGFLIRFRKIGLLSLALVTLFFASQILKMEMFTQFLDLFPSNHPYVEVHKKYSRYFGSAYQATLMLEVKSGDVFNTATLEKITRIQSAVDLIPGVDHFGIASIASSKEKIIRETPEGISVKPVMKNVPQTEEEIEEFKKRIFTSDHIYGTLVSRDRKALLLNANFHQGKLDFNTLFKKFMEIKTQEEDANHKVYLSGQPLIYGWIYHHLPEMGVIFALTVVIILAMLYGYMRGWGYWWIPFLTAVTSSIWGLGFAAMWGFHFDPLIIVIPFLLSARAISHAVQWYERFMDEYCRTYDTQEAAHITGAALFPPGLLGIVTDAAGLFVISLTPIPILKNLAYLGTAWALSVIPAVLIFLPMFFASVKSVKVNQASLECEIGRIERHLTAITNWTLSKGQYVVLLSAAAILLFGIVSSVQLKYGDANPGSPILRQNSEYNLDTATINSRFPGVDQMWVVFEAEGEYPAIVHPELMQGMEALKQHIIEDPNVGHVISMADLVKSLHMLVYGNDPKFESLPQDRKSIADLVSFYKLGAGPGDFDKWAEPTASAANVRIFLKDHKGETIGEVIERVKIFIAENENLMKKAVMKPAGGLGGILAAANEVIAVKNHQLLIMVLSIVFILCALTYRSFLAGGMFVLSLVMANFLAFAYMGFKNIGLNINTLPVVALGIGLGVDYGLYIISRIKDTYAETNNLSTAVITGVSTSGRAVFMTATMMTAGVFFWYFSPLRFHAEMGILLGILMMSNMLVGILVLPAIINRLKPKFILGKKKSGKISLNSNPMKGGAESSIQG
jgi:predicted RND superfamily exporter protein